MTFQFWGGTDAETEFRADFMSTHTRPAAALERFRHSRHTGGSAKAQLDRFIKRWVEEERQALEQQKRAKLAAEGLAPTGTLKCDLCPPTDPTTYKSTIFLNRHKDSAHR